MTIIVDLLKINEETEFGNFFTDEDAKLILDIFNSKPYCMGELDPHDGFDILLSNVSHSITKIWIEDDNRIWGEIKILETIFQGKILCELIKPYVEDINRLKAVNRHNKILSILEDKEYKYIYPSDILRQINLYPSLRGAGVNGKLTKFFTFDIRTYDNKQLLFADKN